MCKELQEAVDIINEYLSIPQGVVQIDYEIKFEELIALEKKRREALKLLVCVAEKVIEGTRACL